MAQVDYTMTASAVPGMEETCHGCDRKFRRGERMNGMRYDDGESAGWHCDECLASWREKGESSLPRWRKESEAPHANC